MLSKPQRVSYQVPTFSNKFYFPELLVEDEDVWWWMTNFIQWFIFKSILGIFNVVSDLNSVIPVVGVAWCRTLEVKYVEEMAVLGAIRTGQASHQSNEDRGGEGGVTRCYYTTFIPTNLSTSSWLVHSQDRIEHLEIFHCMVAWYDMITILYIESRSVQLWSVFIDSHPWVFL